MQIIVSPVLPIDPPAGEVARRIVRHGLADVLTWLGEPVGPAPADRTHVVYGFDGTRDGAGVMCVSQEVYDRLAATPRGKPISLDLDNLPKKGHRHQ